MKNAARVRGEEPASDDGEGASRVDLGVLPTHVGYAIRRAQLLIFQNFIRTLAELDIRPGQFALLTVIAATPGLTQSAASEALGIKRENLVAMLDTLERRGLAERRKAASDRRSHALHLTEEGEGFLVKLNALAEQHESTITDAVGTEGKQTLLRLLEAITDRLS